MKKVTKPKVTKKCICPYLKISESHWSNCPLHSVTPKKVEKCPYYIGDGINWNPCRKPLPHKHKMPKDPDPLTLSVTSSEYKVKIKKIIHKYAFDLGYEDEFTEKLLALFLDIQSQTREEVIGEIRVKLNDVFPRPDWGTKKGYLWRDIQEMLDSLKPKETKE